MPAVIHVAHDFPCPWCWVGLLQAMRLVEEEGVQIHWDSYELWPVELARPLPQPPTIPNPNRPPVPSRFELLLAAEGMEMPQVTKPSKIVTHSPHEALLFAQEHGFGMPYAEAIYRAYWERGEDVSDPGVLVSLAKSIGIDSEELGSAVNERRYEASIVGFDAPAYTTGIFNVPTFRINGERYAEQPYRVLQRAVRSTAAQ